MLALFPDWERLRACFSGFLKLFVEQKRFSILAIAQKRHTGELETNSGVKSSMNVLALPCAVVFSLKPSFPAGIMSEPSRTSDFTLVGISFLEWLVLSE